ncbi:nucleotidyl transferase AbiEii/AbiGii toxin family protein [Haploplasma axanthum]|uniref:Nucleotidyl transferase of uncharacterized function (DUF1814) n=1 Tax=Haploplasma axanthum TaxID=29552 RepID=A0A449BD91_HAPAX|nr:nucleotidyl transferase AbiEii/AbiGii toxin family protein [Haploplasma axanthum]VEU80406.1 Nucleotidyl transferase of uncharacterised function (DUF1814) [Haploplasma axanthum]
MIKKETFDLNWIMTFNGKPQRANPEIIEKEIYALKLLELLLESKLDFIFKGGTCLSLILQEFTRFSIDIDITVDMKEGDIDSYLSVLNYQDYFLRFERQERPQKGKLLKRHYKFYYMSKHNEKEDYVLLDIVFEKTIYNEIEKTKLDFLLLQTTEPYYYVKTPSLKNILIDKLTAFAPNTIGITYESEKYMEIIKQMYDVSKISKKISEEDILIDLYPIIAGIQIKNRNLKIDFKNTLTDTIYTALDILTQGEYSNEKHQYLKSAINGFRGYVYGNKFTYIDAEDAAIDVLYISTIILVEGIEKFKQISEQKIVIKNLEVFSKNFRTLKGNHTLSGQFTKLESSLKVLKFIEFSL